MSYQGRGPDQIRPFPQPPPSRPAPRDHLPLIMGGSLTGILLAFAALVVWAMHRGDAVYAEFMSGCEKDHKHYECMLLWRASKSDDPTVVPVPVFIPNTR